MQAYNKDILLLGTSQGLYIMNRKLHYQPIPVPALTGKDVRFIKTDPDGNIWLGTYGSGYYHIAGTKLTRLPEDEHNYLSFVHAIIEDSLGRFWMPTNHGLFVTTRNSLLSFAADHRRKPFLCYFDKTDGLTSSEFNGGGQPSFLFLWHKNGQLSLPTVKGLVFFDPLQVPVFSSADTTIGIEQIWADNEQISADKKRPEIKNNVRNIIVNVFSSSWGKAANNMPEYQLVKTGDSTDITSWISVPPSGNIVIPRPSHGNYILVIRKRTGFKDTDYAYQELYFNVLPRWYQTNIFMLLAMLLIVGATIMIARLRIYILISKARQLQQKIDDATQQLKEMNLSLEYNLQIKNRLISIFSHDVAAPLQYMSMLLKERLKRTKDSDPNYKSLTIVSQTSTQLQLLADDLISWIQVQQEGINFQPVCRHFALLSLVLEKWEPVAPVATRKNITLYTAVSPGFQCYTDKNILGIILYNTLSNAVKFSTGGSIHVTATSGQNHITILVTDEGVGFSPEQLERSNKFLSVEPEKGTYDEMGKGIGLKIIRDLILVLGGTIHISSEREKGTAVTITLPGEKEM